MQKASAGDWLALIGAAALAITSFFPYWAELDFADSDSLIVFEGPSGFSLWDAYPLAVKLGVGLSFIVLALGLARVTMGRPSTSPAVIYLGAGAVMTLLLLYGFWEGPIAVFPFLVRDVVGPTEFLIERGPLVYVAPAAALAVMGGGLLAKRARPG